MDSDFTIGIYQHLKNAGYFFKVILISINIYTYYFYIIIFFSHKQLVWYRSGFLLTPCFKINHMPNPEETTEQIPTLKNYIISISGWNLTTDINVSSEDDFTLLDGLIESVKKQILINKPKQNNV